MTASVHCAAACVTSQILMPSHSPVPRSFCPHVASIACAQVAAVTAVRDGLAEELTVSQERVRLGQEILQETQFKLDCSQRELDVLTEKHQHLIQQHDRSEAELGDLHSILLANKADAEALEARWAADCTNCSPLLLLAAVRMRQKAEPEKKCRHRTHAVCSAEAVPRCCSVV